MSEIPDQGLAPGQGAVRTASAGPSAGALIRRAREDAGMHIAALAVSLKVPVKRLEALEADRYDLLPDVVFARALARSVCRNLKIDPDLVLPLLPQGQVQPLSVEGRINEPFRPDQQGPGGWLPQVSRPALIAGVLLVLAALAVYVVPELTRENDAPAQPAPVMQPAPAAPAADAGSAPAAVAPGSVVEAVPSAGAPTGTSPAATPAPATPVVPVVPVPVAPNPPATR